MWGDYNARAGDFEKERHMKRSKDDEAREERIMMEIVVDANGEEERAMGWYYYLQDSLPFPFKATYLRQAKGGKGKPKVVTVTGMAEEEECQGGMQVLMEWEGDEMAVALERLTPVDVGAEALQAIEDWKYWVGRGYRF
jgi:Calcium binding